MSDLPSAVLFACTMNSIRSPMAESILKFLHGDKIYVDSAGVRSLDRIFGRFRRLTIHRWMLTTPIRGATASAAAKGNVAGG